MSTKVKEVIEAVVGPSKEDVGHIHKIISDAWDKWVPPLEKNKEWIYFQKALAAGENWAKKVMSSPEPWGEGKMRREAQEYALKDFCHHLSELLTDYLGLRISVIQGKDWRGSCTSPKFADPGIEVKIPPHYSKDDHSVLTRKLTHELVHSGQWEKMGLNPKWDHKQFTQKIYKRDLDKQKSGKQYTRPQFYTMASMDDYLNSKLELMPRAREYVDALRRSGLSNDEILQRLKGGIEPGVGAPPWPSSRLAPLSGVTHPQSKRRALRYAADYAQQ